MAGLKHRVEMGVGGELSVLEIGLGTGLNALLTCHEAHLMDLPIHYTSLEPYPIDREIYCQLNYGAEWQSLLQSIHEAPWQEPIKLGGEGLFTLEKCTTKLEAYTPQRHADLIYFDAFSPEAQPELWEEFHFRRMYEHSNPRAVLVTYCAKGEVRRRLERSGWRVERLPGPPGKREILRAEKPDTTI